MGHKGYHGQYTGNSKFSKDHAHTRVTSGNYKATERDDAAHIDYLKRDIDYDNKHGHSDKKMTADEKHISKLAGDMKYDKEHHGSPAKNRGGRNDHDMSDKYWEAHKKTIHGMRSHGGVNMNSPARQEQGDFDYEDPNYRKTKEYKKFQRKQKRQERKAKRNAAAQKHCMN